MEKRGRRFGDRRAGTLLRDPAPMHFIVLQIHPNRCDNEAHRSGRIDLGPVNAYLKKNAAEMEFSYILFPVIPVGLLKTITLRPRMNRFVANKSVYQRNGAAAFLVKKRCADDGGEALAIARAKGNDTIGGGASTPVFFHPRFLLKRKTVKKRLQACRKSLPAFFDRLRKTASHMGRGLSRCVLAKHGRKEEGILSARPRRERRGLAGGFRRRGR